MSLSLSDLCTCAPGFTCDHEGCSKAATVAIEWQDDDYGHRFWESFCDEHEQAGLRKGSEGPY